MDLDISRNDFQSLKGVVFNILVTAEIEIKNKLFQEYFGLFP